ncbi:related to amidohydrolase family protein [Cephalotrichum gorgonifer]|uniref:Related to amidohydrolase family protein n=1 Tax=Cephalotrichum gorgonifer TaxID=2041049 RepID=A0AAE8N5I5_9PEZI|nr:related to amidohydrolase family protein [Cephalotrichum gorgonifer]
MIFSSILLHQFIAASAAANILFQGATVISFDEDAQSVQVLRNSSLLVEGKKITAIFPSGFDSPIPEDTEVIPSNGKIISPGFIDTHRHLWQTAYRTIGSNITLASYSAAKSPFVQHVIDRFQADDVYYGQLFGIRESLNAGVTAIVDHAHGTFTEDTADASLRASIDAGARTYWSFGVHTPLNNYTLDLQWQSLRTWAETIDWDATPVKLRLSFDEFSTVQQDVIDDIRRNIRDFNISVLSTHHLGGPWIAPNSPTLLNGLGLLDTDVPVIFAHGTFITPDDLNLLREHNHYVAISAESEMHFGHDYPYAHKAMDQAALAVDAHFTYSADIVTQARI